MWAYIDGRFVEKETPVITLEDRGLTFGDGLFEVTRTMGGKVLFLAEHLQRMRCGAGFFQLTLPLTDEEIRARARELLARNAVDEGELYIELTRGADSNREHRFPPARTPGTFFLLSFPLRRFAARNWEHGARVITYPDRRHGFCEHKTLNLLANVMAKNAALAAEAYEALMYREGADGVYVTEGGSSSYFCVCGGRLLTPAIDNILPGITRRKVIALAREAGIETRETRVPLETMLGADEVFITSTISRVMPVRAIDERTFPAPGPITRRLMEDYAAVYAAGFR